MNDLESESFRLIIADPPYRIESWAGFGAKHNRTYDIEPPKYSEWIPRCFQLLKNDGSIFVFEHPRNERAVEDALLSAGFTIQPHLVWFVSFRKSHPAKGMYNSHWEPIIWATKSPKGWYFDSKPLRGLGSHWGGDVFEAGSVNNKMKIPGQKPVKLIKRLIDVHTEPGDRVLDPFLGGGSTLQACAESGRDGVGIEISEDVVKKVLEYRKWSGENLK